MNSVRTAIILGAGASYCYEEGNKNFPTQENIIGRLFVGLDTRSGAGAPTFSGLSGLKHSYQLGQYIRTRFNIPEDTSRKMSKTDFWTILQRKGYTLESLYSEIETDVDQADNGKWAAEDFEAIVRTAVTEPNSDREPNKVCRYHRMLCEALEPGDYVINFNWDTLMADALLFHSQYWFPATGFGLNNVYPLMRPGQKRHQITSLVQLFHVHGAVCLFERMRELPNQNPSPLYLGPKTYPQGNTFTSLLGVEKGAGGEAAKITREASDEEMRRATLGYLFFDDKWFKPIFVPPSKYKREYSHWYSKLLRRAIYTALPTTQQFIIAGYSFPEADIQHLCDLFISKVISPDAEVTVINPSNNDTNFRNRIKIVFPEIRHEPDYRFKDFQEYCLGLDTSRSYER